MSWLSRFFKKRRQRQVAWDKAWSDPRFNPPWLRRGASKEVIEAARDGWFPEGGATLDIGCGEGDIAAWMAEHGFPAIGVDIAPAAIERARSRHREEKGRLEFRVLDIRTDAPPARDYRILIDRGCIHQLPPEDSRRYLDSVLSVSAPDARMLLFVKAFREGQAGGDPGERKRIRRDVEARVGAAFAIERMEEAWLDTRQELPGVVFWLIRK